MSKSTSPSHSPPSAHTPKSPAQQAQQAQPHSPHPQAHQPQSPSHQPPSASAPSPQKAHQSPVERKDSPPCSPKVQDELKRMGYMLGEKLGYGSFSRVYKAISHGRETACKVIDIEKTSNDYRYKFLPRELYTLRRLRHPNIIFIYDIIPFGQKTYIFMDLAEGGDILEYIKANGAIPEPKAKVWFKQVSDALKYCHHYGIVHRDIKSENILLDRAGYAKLTDFGFSRICYDARTGRRVRSETFCGSTAYVAPEVLQGIPYYPMMSDCWSMGVVLYVMVNNALPFDDSDQAKLLKAQIERKWQYNKKVEAGLTAEVKDLISSLLEPNLDARLSMTKVLCHKWLAGVLNRTPAIPTIGVGLQPPSQILSTTSSPGSAF